MIKSRVVGSALVALMSFSLCGTWKLGNVKNYSDLELESAWYNKPKEKMIHHLTDVITQHNQQKSKIIPFNYTVSEKSIGCSMIMTKSGYRITFDGNPTHSFLWNRAHTKSTAKKQVPVEQAVDFKQESLIGKMPDPQKYSHTARAFIEAKGDDGNFQKPICSVAQGYNQNNQIFDLVIRGSSGKYTLELLLPVVA